MLTNEKIADILVFVQRDASTSRRNTQAWLKGSVLKTDRGVTARGGSNPSSSAIFFIQVSNRSTLFLLSFLVEWRHFVYKWMKKQNIKSTRWKMKASEKVYELKNSYTFSVESPFSLYFVWHVFHGSIEEDNFLRKGASSCNTNHCIVRIDLKHSVKCRGRSM